MRFKVIPEPIQSILIDPIILKQWSSLSLIERCRKLKFDYDLKLSYNTLRDFYGEKGISYRKAYYSKRKKIELTESR